MAGISSLQGSHQLAQKLTKTTLPLVLLREKGLPSISVPSILGAVCPTSIPANAVLDIKPVNTIKLVKQHEKKDLRIRQVFHENLSKELQ